MDTQIEELKIILELFLCFSFQAAPKVSVIINSWAAFELLLQVGYLNPFYWITKIPSVKRYHARKGIDDFEKVINGNIADEKIGYASYWAIMQLGGLLILIELGSFNLWIKKNLLIG